MSDIAVVGSVAIDRIVRGEVQVRKSGGVVVYGGLTLRREGLRVAVCSNLGARDGDVLKALERVGVDICCAESECTTSFVNYVDGDVRYQDMPCAAAPISKAQLMAVCSKVEWVLLGPLHPEDIDVEALYWLGEQGVQVSLDVQGYARKVSQGRVWPEISEQMRPALRCSRHVKMAHEELELLLAFEGLDLVALMRAYALDEVVVTDGSRGGYVCCADGEEIAFRAVHVDRALDPTGAGDVFFAAYLAQRQFLGASIKAAVVHAAARAAEQVEGRYIAQSELLLQ